VLLVIEQTTPAPPADYDPAEAVNAATWFGRLQANSALMAWSAPCSPVPAARTRP
jgi:hypothetical protein